MFPFRQIYFALALLVFVTLVGMSGYMYLEGFRVLDAFYMTIITISTAGFQEVHPLSDNGKIFTAFLIITSFGTFAYALTAISKYVVDGEFNNYLKNYRVTSEIEKLQGHVIICGYGRNGKQAAHILKRHNQRFVVIEQKKDVIAAMNQKHASLVLEGDSTRDEILENAGIKRASALITTLPIDADNLFIVLSAKALNPNLTIISRASDDNTDKKLKIAGATNVIMPDKIGGAHMASLVLKPDVMEFVDFITGQGTDNIRLEEISFEKLPAKFQNKSIREFEIRNKSGANIIGYKTASGDYIVNPSPDTPMYLGSKLFVLGTAEQIANLKKIVV